MCNYTSSAYTYSTTLLPKSSYSQFTNENCITKNTLKIQGVVGCKKKKKKVPAKCTLCQKREAVEGDATLMGGIFISPCYLLLWFPPRHPGWTSRSLCKGAVAESPSAGEAPRAAATTSRWAEDLLSHPTALPEPAQLRGKLITTSGTGTKAKAE